MSNLPMMICRVQKKIIMAWLWKTLQLGQVLEETKEKKRMYRNLELCGTVRVCFLCSIYRSLSDSGLERTTYVAMKILYT